jgi:hypothetical protein
MVIRIRVSQFTILWQLRMQQMCVENIPESKILKFCLLYELRY